MMNILFFMAALSCMAGYASTEVDRTGTWLFVLKLFIGAAIIIVFERVLAGCGTIGLFTFVTAVVCTLVI